MSSLEPVAVARRRAAWPFPYADEAGGRLDRRAWAFLLATFLAIHFLALLVATRTGNFSPVPNPDHTPLMRDVLARGYPQAASWPPGLGYYMAAKSLLASALGLPYWSGKILVDPLVFVASGVLSTMLGARLTRNRWLAVASGLGLTAAPLFALCSAEELAELPFQPPFLGALLILVRELQREPRPRAAGLVAGGALLGTATLIRANPQFLLVALAPVTYAILRRRGHQRAALAALATLAVAGLGQALVVLPWSLVLHGAQRPAVLAAPVFLPSFYNGVARTRGNRIAEELRRAPEDPDRSVDGIVRFHLRWAAKDPAALAGLYARRLGRAWYLSSSGRWDRWIVTLHSPMWLLALGGMVLWIVRWRGDPTPWLALSVIVYLWIVSALASGLARYLAAIYGLVGMFAGVALMAAAGAVIHAERSRSRSTSSRRISSA